jgi:hypothetical protein
MKTQFFTESFLDALPDDPLLALAEVCTEFRKFDQAAAQKPELHGDYLSAVAVLQALAKSRTFSLPIPVPGPGANAQQNINNIRDYIFQIEGHLTQRLHSDFIQRESDKYSARFEADSAYVFPDDDYKRIQELLNEMRDILSNTKSIPEKHKRRLLERLERMQRELHKKTSDLDRFWGFIGEVGIAAGKFGKDIKPFVDRVRELTEIVSKAIQVKEKLAGRYNPISLPESNSDGNLAT